MKKILVIGCVILISAACDQTSNSKAQQDNLMLQGQCATQAKQFFDNHKWSPIIDYNYQNHYSGNLGKCYVLVSGLGASGSSDQLWDAYKNKNIAECESYSVSDMNFCGYGISSEKYDLNKFRAFVKQYMEN